MKKIFLILFILLFAVGFVLNGWADTKPEDTLYISSMTFGSETFDPIVLNAVWLDAIYNTVLRFDPQGNIIPRLAESYSLSPDGKVWTFKVRKGVKFHNGDEMTSADFTFSFNRFTSPQTRNPWSPIFKRVLDHVEAPDPYTWVLYTKTPEPMLFSAFIALHITPKDYIEKNGIEYFRKHPVGTGAWKVVNFVSGSRLELEAVKDHWLRTPAFEKVVYDLVPEESTRIARLKRGEADIVAVSTDRAAELKAEGYRLQPYFYPSLPTISFPGTWLTKGPTSDIRVRQALSFAINRQEICDTFFRGFATPGGSWFMSDATWGWDPAWKPDPYDPEKAVKLLQEAGYPGKFQDPVIKVYSTGATWLPNFMQILSGYWEAVGVKTMIEPVDGSQLNRMFFVRGSEGIIGTVVPFVSAAQPFNVYHSQNMYTSRGIHTTGNDPKLDELYEKLVMELDPQKAKERFREFQAYGMSQYIVLGTVQVFDQLALSPKVGEFAADMNIAFTAALSGIQHRK